MEIPLLVRFSRLKGIYMIKVVLFDFHNTLATCDSWLELEIKTLPGLALARLRSEGYLDGQPEHSPEEATKLFRELRADVRKSGVELSAFEGTKRVLAQMDYHVPDEALLAVVAELEYDCLLDLEIMPGAHECLRSLSERGYRLGVVSSAGFPPFVESALETLGLRTYFNEVLTSAGEGIYKSDPEIFRRAVERLDAVPSEAVHIGDHAIYDVQAAHAAGLSAIWFSAQAERTARLHNANWDDLQKAGSEAEAVVTSLEEVPGAVEALR
ncbi:MAG: HAD family hydrolase [Chloroflexota bacterium]